MQDENYIIHFVDRNRGGDYRVTIDIDYEEDNMKAFTYVKTPDGKSHMLDITPYDPSEHLIKMMITFYVRYGYFITRKNTGSGGSVIEEEIEELSKEAFNYQFENAPTKAEE